MDWTSGVWKRRCAWPMGHVFLAICELLFCGHWQKPKGQKKRERKKRTRRKIEIDYCERETERGRERERERARIDAHCNNPFLAPCRTTTSGQDWGPIVSALIVWLFDQFAMRAATHLVNANTESVPGRELPPLPLPPPLSTPFPLCLPGAASAGDEIAIILQTMKLLLRVQT